ncbi:MAG: DotI/IcmL family type IV secretion protein [Proteobacteria bacterium]|nr:DotI/IcmL family type IV secretion protein [Pseudomonadota bacterium]
MRIITLTGLFFTFTALQAAEPTDLATLQMRMKEIEVRLSLIERDLAELKHNKMPSVPLEQANLPSPQVLIWTSENIEQIYTYNYKDFPQVLTQIRGYFTQQGYDSYMKALDESKNLQAVQDKRLYVTAKVAQKGKVVKEGIVNGIYTWEVQIPIDVTYKSTTESVVQKLQANVEVVRVPSNDSPVGIAIHSITASIAPTEQQKPAEGTTRTNTGATPPSSTNGTGAASSSLPK